jgi:hypothetical protein
MDKALWKAPEYTYEAQARPHSWSRRMSNHIAFALLVYTGLNIVLTVGAIKGALQGSILPYFSLVILVGMIIPGCRWLEKRWERCDRQAADDVGLQRAFRRDRALVWIAAITLPVIITALFNAVTMIA